MGGTLQPRRLLSTSRLLRLERPFWNPYIRTRSRNQAPFVTALAVTVSELEHTGTKGEAVRKRVLEAGTAKLAQKGDQVEVEYIGAVAGKDWTVDDVLECWLAVCVCAIICTVVRACLRLSCSRARARSVNSQ